MVPFFGSRVTQNVNEADTLRKVETFTGQLGLNNQHKEEMLQEEDEYSEDSE